ncbi:MAG: SH3 domain-containing protein, partial [Clostridiales bacterium]|nr:SH3 domain-containing protein [Clostridiales bacterium]
MKRIISILLIVTMTLGLMSLVGAGAVADTTTSSYATVTSSNGYGVRMREGPGKNYNVITKYAVNTTVTVLQRGSEWSQITVGGLTGWMQNVYLVFGSSGVTPSNPGTSGATATVTSGNGLRVWLRATAGGKRLALYKPGTQVTVLQKGDKWCHISIGGSIGYMMTQFLDFGPAPAPVPLVVKGVSVNYPYPNAGDVLEARVDPSEATVTYSWKVEGVEQATGSTFNVLAKYEGKVITLDVKGTGSYTGSAHTQTEKVQNDPYVRAVTLSKSNPVVGDVLSANIQPSSATVDYAWRVGGTLMSSDPTYTVQADDVGKPIQLKVTGIGNFFGSAVVSAQASVISQYEMQSVTVSKETPVVGDVLTISVVPENASIAVAWYVGGEKVADTASYKVEGRDLGKNVEVKVSGVAPYTGTVNAHTNRVASAMLSGVSVAGSTLSGGTVWAQLSPSGADATYQWYLQDGTAIPGATAGSLTLDKAWVGKKVYVVATGAGVYGGAVSSNLSGEILNNQNITAVKLNNTSPVVGDTLTAQVTPTDADVTKLSFVWSIDTRVESGTGKNTYTVQPADVGKTIRVRVIGAGDYTGEAYSAWTNAVVSAAKINSVSIYNVTQGNNAQNAQPRVGDTLRADLDPGQASDKVMYVWQSTSNDRDWTNVGNGRQITYPANAGRLRVIAEQVSGSGYYIDNNEHKLYAVTNWYAYAHSFDLKVDITAPTAGATPQTSASGSLPVEWDKNNKATRWENWSANIVWRLKNGDHASVMDEYNHYWGGTEYEAVVYLTVPNSYGLVGSNNTKSKLALRCGGKEYAAVYNDSSKAWVVTGFSTSTYQATDFNITGIARPVIGEQATWGLSGVSSQYTVESIAWTGQSGGVFIAAEKYEATLTLKASTGFTFANVPANAFKVADADATRSTVSTDGQTVTVIATYNAPTQLILSSDMSQVEMDGKNRRIVQLTARLSNGQPITKLVWSVANSDANGTYVEETTAQNTPNVNAKLLISPQESTGKSLKVKATCGSLTAELTIALVSGENYNNSLQVFINRASTKVVLNGTGSVELDFSAYVRNSLLGVNWRGPDNAKSGNTKLTKTDDYNATLTIGADEEAKYIVLRAESKENKGVEQAKVIIAIVRDEKAATSTVSMTSMLLSPDDTLLALENGADVNDLIQAAPEEEAATLEALDPMPVVADDQPAEEEQPEAPASEEDQKDKVPEGPTTEEDQKDKVPEGPTTEEDQKDKVPEGPTTEEDQKDEVLEGPTTEEDQ